LDARLDTAFSQGHI
jgi:thiosulfate/3-mercaptopyruvate sulfurtransferase